GVPAAGLAGEDRRIAAPVDEDEALLAASEALLDRAHERRRETLLGRLPAQVDDAHRGQRRARHGALREREVLVAAVPRVLPALERGRRAAEDHRAAGELRAVDGGVAPGVAQPFLLLEGGVVLLVDD